MTEDFKIAIKLLIQYKKFYEETTNQPHLGLDSFLNKYPEIIKEYLENEK